MAVSNGDSILLERFPALFFCFTYGEKMAFDRTEAPLASIEKEVLRLPLSTLSTLYLYGIGKGIHYPLLKQWLHSSLERRLIILQEDMQELETFLTETSSQELLSDPQVIVYPLLPTTSLDEHVQTLVNEYPCDRIEVLTSYEKKSSYFRRLRLELLRKSVLSCAIMMESLKYPKLLANVTANISHWKDSFIANHLKGKFVNTPAIICGAGPSLQQEIPFLKQLGHRALILAGGSTITALSRYGIEPHLGLAIDPNPEEFLRLKEASLFHTPLIYGTRLQKDILNCWGGEKGYLISDTGGPCERYFESHLGMDEDPIGPELGLEALSVTTLATALAVQMGCNPILFCGVDLSYKEQQRYAEGILQSFAPDFDSRASERLLKRKDIHGQSVWTAVRWVMERECLSQFAKQHPHIRFIQVSQAGLGFKGIENRSLQEVMQSELTLTSDLRGKLHALMQTYPSSLTCEQITEEKQEIRKSAEKLLLLCKECIEELTQTKEAPFPSPRFALLQYEMEQECAWQCLNPLLDAALDRLRYRWYKPSCDESATSFPLAKLRLFEKTLQEQISLFS